MVNFKQVIIMNKSLGMRTGKVAAQACHASVKAALLSSLSVYSAWDEQGHKKIVLWAENVEKLANIANEAAKYHTPTALIVDQGLTQVEPDSVTALAIGPDSESLIDMLTSDLKLV